MDLDSDSEWHDWGWVDKSQFIKNITWFDYSFSHSSRFHWNTSLGNKYFSHASEYVSQGSQRHHIIPTGCPSTATTLKRWASFLTLSNLPHYNSLPMSDKTLADNLQPSHIFFYGWTGIIYIYVPSAQLLFEN